MTTNKSAMSRRVQSARDARRLPTQEGAIPRKCQRIQHINSNVAAFYIMVLSHDEAASPKSLDGTQQVLERSSVAGRRGATCRREVTRSLPGRDAKEVDSKASQGSFVAANPIGRGDPYRQLYEQLPSYMGGPGL